MKNYWLHLPSTDFYKHLIFKYKIYYTMATGLLHLHNVLRWVILIFLLINIINQISGNRKIGLSKILLISAHTTLLLGLFQYFTGQVGFNTIVQNGFGECMKDGALRFWAVEHILGNIIGIVFITISHVKLKKGGNPRTSAYLLMIALVIIMVSIPWPFRELNIARPLFPGMGI